MNLNFKRVGLNKPVVAIFLGSLFLSFISSCSYRTIKQQSVSSEGMVNDAQNRMQWELKRLADPATGRIPEFARQKELAFAATLPNDAIHSIRRNGNTWVNRGPYNVGGRTRAFGVDISNENRILAGSASGGMWLSEDGGMSWKMTNTNSQLKNVTCLAQDKRSGHANIWYYGSGEASGASASGTNAYYLGDGMFKSVDSGKTWNPILSTSGGTGNSFTINWQLIWNTAVDLSAPDTMDEVYAATYRTIYRSINGGNNWSPVLSSTSYYSDVELTSNGVVYATFSSEGNNKGIWRSVDGVNFTNITPANFPSSYKRIVMGINPSNENEVYFLAHTPGFGLPTYDYNGNAEWNSFYKYTYKTGNGKDTGGAWLDLSNNLPNTGGKFDKWTVQGAYDMVVKVKPGNNNIVYIGGTNLYRSTSGFTDATHTAFIGGYEENADFPVVNMYQNHHPDQHGIAFLPSNANVMYSANDGGLFKTEDNEASKVVWESLNNGYLTTMFYTVAIDHATPGNNIITGGAQDNGSWFTNSSDPKLPWITPRGGDGSYCAISDNRSMYYFSIQNGKMMKAKLDENGNKTGFARIDPIGLRKPKFINPYVLDPVNNNIMYLAGGKYLWRNNDLSGIPLAGNWDSISTNWVRFTDSVPFANVSISAITACKIPQNRVYYGTDNKRLYRVDNANVGTPKPIDVTGQTAPLVFPAGGNISSIAVDPRNGDNVMVTFSNYGVYSIYYSSDAGLTWSKAAGNLEPSDGTGPSVRWASILPVSDGVVYLVATSTGLYATRDLNGVQTVWVQQGTNTIGNSVCDMIDTRVSDGLVVVATHSNGIYSTNYTSVNNITSIEDIEPLLSNLNLRNFPNPAQNTTTIGFKLESKSEVSVQLWDECGRLVRTLLKEVKPEGEITLTLNCEGLKPGIYYYSLIAGEIRKTNKFVVID